VNVEKEGVMREEKVERKEKKRKVRRQKCRKAENVKRDIRRKEKIEEM
jgi:hypothetical protein